jgi:hypothetical protein
MADGGGFALKSMQGYCERILVAEKCSMLLPEEFPRKRKALSQCGLVISFQKSLPTYQHRVDVIVARHQVGRHQVISCVTLPIQHRITLDNIVE